jgi:Lar family restriction alleviation protein
MSPEQIKNKLPPPLTGPRILPDKEYTRPVLVCPFCGNPPDPYPFGNGYGYAIECNTCQYDGPWGDTAEMAIKAWNTREGV